MFKKKKVVLEFPKDKVYPLLDLSETFEETLKKQDRFRLWSFVEEIFPETREGTWQLTYKATRAFVEKLSDK
jgi:superfamily I DNA/RNA helicase